MKLCLSDYECRDYLLACRNHERQERQSETPFAAKTLKFEIDRINRWKTDTLTNEVRTDFEKTLFIFNPLFICSLKKTSDIKKHKTNLSKNLSKVIERKLTIVVTHSTHVVALTYHVM